MATVTICTPCLRVMRLHARIQAQNVLRTSGRKGLPLQTLNRPFSNTTHQNLRATFTRSAKEAPPRISMPGSSPPVPPPPEIESLSTSSSTQTPPTQQHPAAFQSFAQTIRSNASLRSATEPYIAYGSTEDLYLICSRTCAYTIPSRHSSPSTPAPQSASGEDIGEPEQPNTFWYAPKSQGGLELDVTFYTWAQVVFLHMYMLTVRLRTFPPEHAKIWHQQLLDHFFYAAEDRMATWHNISARGTRNKYLKDLWQQWRGVIFSYDEGLIKGDAVLAGAVWRNVFKGNPECDISDLALVVAYLRRELKMLDQLSDEELSAARVRFGEPGTLRGVVEKQSAWMKRPFEKEGGKSVTDGQ